jgi:hypothetical protein
MAVLKTLASETIRAGLRFVAARSRDLIISLRSAIAENPQPPVETLQQLAQDEDENKSQYAVA